MAQNNLSMKGLILTILLTLSFVLVCQVSADEITIVGTGDGVNVLDAIGTAFTEQNPSVNVSVPKSIGSGGGVKAVGNEKFMLGRVARGIKDKEKHFGLSYKPYAKIPTVFFVNIDVGIDNLTAQQVCDIYSGTVTNWSEVGGSNGKIRVVRREDGDSSLKVLKKTFPGFKELVITKKSKTAGSTPENFSTVEQKKNTIGFGPYDVAKSADVKILKIDGKSPHDPAYPSVGTMGLIYKEKNVKGSIKDFLDFALSDNAHDAIKKAGGIPQ